MSHDTVEFKYPDLWGLEEEQRQLLSSSAPPPCVLTVSLSTPLLLQVFTAGFEPHTRRTGGERRSREGSECG